MARDHARLKTAIWQQADWRGLTVDAQWLYGEAILSQPRLTYAGVLDWRPSKIATLAKGMTVRRIEKAALELSDAHFVVIDDEAEEILLRSYVRHDGVLDRANMGKAVARALAVITSLRVRQAVMIELGRLYEESPTLAGWHGIADLYPDVMAEVSSMASVMTLPIPSRKA